MRLFFAFAFCLIGFLCLAQTPQRHFGPERKDNAILIETHDADSLAYEKLLQILSANDWLIDQQDRKYFVIKTTIRPIPAIVSAETYLTIKKTASNPTTIRITGFLKATVNGTTVTDEVNNSGAENGAYKKSFYKMQDIAKAYENGNVLYGRK